MQEEKNKELHKRSKLLDSLFGKKVRIYFRGREQGTIGILDDAWDVKKFGLIDKRYPYVIRTKECDILFGKSSVRKVEEIR